ncbi:Iron-containing alcohol dehydrogenase [Rhodospirillaceae bacterium LM-1]|nr:Iron-containing alcohol dehydrogenase [Rhodospirillaceae bacterium LM-1]
MTELETVFAVHSNSVRFGPGALAEAGDAARDLGMRRVALFTDSHLANATPWPDEVRAGLAKAGCEVAVYADVRVEPTDASFMAATDFYKSGRFDGIVSVGGGSVMDTAKAALLYAAYPAPFHDYVAAPYGRVLPVPGPLPPHIACPTTSGTGAECTGIAVFDFEANAIKTVIAHKWLKPSLALIDPRVAATMTPGVLASSGFDVFTHAIESYTAKPYFERERPKTSAARPMSQGANPWSDLGSLEAIRLGGRYLVRAVKDRQDHEAREGLMFAATLAGIAFGNSGVHLPHAMSYAVAGLCHSYTASGYEQNRPMVPHGISVVLNAPSAFRFTASACPQRHLDCAAALGADISGVKLEEAGEALADALTKLMRQADLPNGLAALGYGEKDLDALAKGAATQPRLLNNSPRPVTEAELREIFKGALRLW